VSSPDRDAGAAASLRVLHIGPTPFFADRGAHIRIRGLMLAQQRRGHEVVLATYHHGSEVDGIRTVRTARIPGYDKVEAGPSPFKYLADLMLLWEVLRLTWSWRPHLLHGHLHEGTLIGWTARTLLFWRRLPLVFDMQGSLTGELDEHAYFRRLPPLRWLFFAVEWLIDRMPAGIAASSRSSLEIARDRFGVSAARLTLVPDGVDVAGAPAPSVGAETARRLGLPAGRTIVVYSGGLLPVKGLDELHASIAAATSAGLPVHFLLIGYPTEATERFLAEHGIADRCTLTGRVDFADLASLLAASDVALEPKRATAGEASGKLLNYMAAGLPVACFDTPNNREMLGESGCYASPNSSTALVDCIGALASDPGRRERLGAVARERALESYSWETSAALLDDLYRSCTGRAS
jgi:glycosyltransferase involved in cell wall biosynthesis